MEKNNYSKNWLIGQNPRYQAAGSSQYSALQTPQYQFTPTYRGGAYSPYSSVSDSFKRMGLGKVGQMGGQLGELEKASMRLRQFEADKKAEEQAREYKYTAMLGRVK